MKVVVYDDAGTVAFQYSDDMNQAKVAPGLAEAERVARYLRLCADSVWAEPWRSLKDDPPPSDLLKFFVGHSLGRRMDYVFRWPHPKTGNPAFWCTGEHGNYLLTDYKPDVWHPGPPPIAGIK